MTDRLLPAWRAEPSRARTDSAKWASYLAYGVGAVLALRITRQAVAGVQQRLERRATYRIQGAEHLS